MLDLTKVSITKQHPVPGYALVNKLTKQNFDGLKDETK
jgi:hypothetical protein